MSSESVCIIIFLIVPGILYIKSRAGKEQVLYEHFTYSCKRTCEAKSLVYWRCSSFENKNCKVRLTINNKTNEVIVKGCHTHEPPQFIVRNGEFIRINARPNPKPYCPY